MVRGRNSSSGEGGLAAEVLQGEAEASPGRQRQAIMVDFFMIGGGLKFSRRKWRETWMRQDKGSLFKCSHSGMEKN